MCLRRREPPTTDEASVGQDAAGVSPYFPPYVARFSPVHCGPCVTATSLTPLSTWYDELQRTSLDVWRSLAKVGVAGSNPVVRSKRKRSSEALFALLGTASIPRHPVKIPSSYRLRFELAPGLRVATAGRPKRWQQSWRNSRRRVEVRRMTRTP